MKELATRSYVPCYHDTPMLSSKERENLRARVPNWHIFIEDDVPKLSRSYGFADFKGALAFTHQVGNIAERENHYPVLITEWGKVTVVWWTHAI